MNAKDLPDPYGFVYNDEFEGGCFGYPHDDVPKRAKPVYTREQVEDILSQRVKTEKFYKPGFFNLPHFFPCQHPEHSPPSMLHVPNGQGYRHICPQCGNISILTSPVFY